MNLKKISLVLMLIVFLALTGCGGSDSGGSDENVVWTGYSNDYFGIKHPEAWKLDESSWDDEIEVNFVIDPNDRYSLGLDIELNLHDDEYLSIDSESDFNKFITDEIKYIESDNGAILNEEREIIIDGYPGHKFIATNNQENIKAIAVYIYYAPEIIYEINYYAKKDEFNNYEGIVNEMINSFEIF
jgi:hypothetical protein